MAQYGSTKWLNTDPSWIRIHKALAKLTVNVRWGVEGGRLGGGYVPGPHGGQLDRAGRDGLHLAAAAISLPTLALKKKINRGLREYIP